MTLCLPVLLMAQTTRKITGQVTEASTGQPLPGATVFIDPDAPESKTYNPAGTMTDVNGHFELTLPVSIKFVVVSFIGYETLKVDISGKTDFTFRLKEESKQLDEVVVTGYQQIEKRKVTSAITTVKAEDIKTIGVASIDQMLEGQVAGVMATPTNGAPGAPAKMRIRSTVSLTGTTDPLWVLDGMILEGNDIPKDFGDKDNIDNLYNTSIAGVNPADIEDITILKDAAATAIYGARAANGVIVVTTKNGKKGKMRVNASASVFYTLRPDLDKLNLMNASEKVDFELGLAAREDFTYRSYKGEVARILSADGALNTFREGGFGALPTEQQEAINRLRSQGADWEKEVYQNALNQQYNLSFSGGSDLVTYYLSTGYYKEEGTTIGTGFERLNLTMKTNFNLLDNLKLGASLFVTQNNRKSYITDADAFTNPANYTRTVNPYREIWQENGDYIYDRDIEGYSGEDLDFNLIEERENTDYTMKSLSVKPIITIDYQPVRGLKFSTQIALQLDKDRTEKFADKNSYFVRKYRQRSQYYDKGYKYFLPDGGVIQNWDSDMSQYQWKLQGEFGRTFADKHDIDVMAGMEMRGDKSTSIHTKGFGYDPKALTTQPLVFPSTINDKNNEIYRQYQKSMYENRYLSYFMTASYTYDNRYTFFGSMRYDGSNLFGVSKKYKYLPLWAVSGAWNVNRESFMEAAEWLSNLKLRASYGLQGNVDKNTSPFIVGTWGNTTILPDNNESSIVVTSPPNQNLRWEKTENWNVGLDAGFWKNRLSFSVDGYYRVSKDLIGQRDLPLENGFLYTTMNWAELTNKGFEFSLSSVNVKTRNFRWVTDFNIAHNKSKVNRVKVPDNSYLPSLEGYSVGALFALKTAGLDEKGLPMFWKEGNKVSFYDFFDIQYSDWGGGLVFVDGSSVSPDDYRKMFTYVGTTEPKFTGGFINRFYYKNFDLTVSTSFILNQTVQETPFYHPTRVSPGANYSKRIFDVWSPENPQGKYPAILGPNTEGELNLAYQWLDGQDPANSFSNYDIWFKKRSYLRVNSIRLGYNLSEQVARKLHLASARLNVETRNPFAFGSSYKGYFDPETYGNIYAQPIARTFSVGLDLTF